MKWLIQKGLYNEDSFQSLLRALESGSINHQVVQVVPFSDILIPEPVLEDKKVFAFGALTMHEIAKKRGWVPGVFSNDSFNYNTMVDNIGEYALNYDAQFVNFGNIEIDSPKFIRPIHDTKSFTGAVFTKEAFKAWQQQTFDVVNSGESYTTLRPETECLVAELKTIVREIRFFIVDGEISTASNYKFLDSPFYSSEIAEEAFDFVRKILSLWQPDKAFVLDVAFTFDKSGNLEYKVVEINSISGSALYASDISKLVYNLNLLLSKYEN
jgi:hypothetical protein